LKKIMEKHEDHQNPHANHETLHNFLLIFLLTFLIIAQIGLYIWKKRHYRSFQNITLAGMWLIPFFFSCYAGFIRMLIVWSIFSILNGVIISKANHKPIQKETPKFVYGWFFLLYRVCYGIALIGYAIFMLDVIGITHIIAHALDLNGFYFSYFGMNLIFYGLYFGVLGRDFAEMCADRMASHLGFTVKGMPLKSLPPSTCCICGDQYQTDDAIKLNCKHMFHEWCIRGWTIVGKKDTCPYCSEKVRLRELFTQPWEKPGVIWAQLMDALRYLIVWNPIIMTTINVFLWYVDPGA